MIFLIDYENYDFLVCFVPRNDVKRENKTVNRHCGLDPQSPAKRYIVIAIREARAAWQSRKASSPLNPPKGDFWVVAFLSESGFSRLKDEQDFFCAPASLFHFPTSSFLRKVGVGLNPPLPSANNAIFQEIITP